MRRNSMVSMLLGVLVALNLGLAASMAVSTPLLATNNGLEEICSSATGKDRPAICADYDQRDTKTADSIVKNVINVLLFVIGSVSVIMIIYGGVRYTTSAGSPEAVKAAKNTILYAVIGLVVAVLAFTIVNFVIGRF